MIASGVTKNPQALLYALRYSTTFYNSYLTPQNQHRFFFRQISNALNLDPKYATPVENIASKVMETYGSQIMKITEKELYRYGAVLPDYRVTEVEANPSPQVTEITEGLGIMDKLKECWNWIKSVVNKIFDFTSNWMRNVQMDPKLAPFYHLSIYQVTIVSILFVIAKHYGERVATKLYRIVLKEIEKNPPK